ncbi:hypothetical protein [Glutamicibacter creatinolyticus]|uniref:hypothetical protein n=1 Tax=Glutamicibacter creatinolyticus TaxID=162496 RepID=UPI0037BE7AB9
MLFPQEIDRWVPGFTAPIPDYVGVRIQIGMILELQLVEPTPHSAFFRRARESVNQNVRLNAV